MKRIITIILLACMCMAAEAKLTLSSLCSDGMVLQQKTEAAIWGFATPGAQVSVTPSWDGKTYRAKADADGRWTAKVATPAASYKPYTVAVKGDGSSLKINDVLVGEVWLASGQSNMEMPMKGFTTALWKMPRHTSAPLRQRRRSGCSRYALPSLMSLSTMQRTADGKVRSRQRYSG